MNTSQRMCKLKLFKWKDAIRPPKDKILQKEDEEMKLKKQYAKEMMSSLMTQICKCE